MQAVYIICLMIVLLLLFIFISNIIFNFKDINFFKADKIHQKEYYNYFIGKINFYLKEINTLKHEVKDESIKNDINDSIFFIRMIALEMDEDIVTLNIFKPLEDFHLSYYTNVLKNYCIKQNEKKYDEMDEIGAVLNRYVNIFNNFSKEVSGEKALKELNILKKYF